MNPSDQPLNKPASEATEPEMTVTKEVTTTTEAKQSPIDARISELQDQLNKTGMAKVEAQSAFVQMTSGLAKAREDAAACEHNLKSIRSNLDQLDATMAGLQLAIKELAKLREASA